MQSGVCCHSFTEQMLLWAQHGSGAGVQRGAGQSSQDCGAYILIELISCPNTQMCNVISSDDVNYYEENKIGERGREHSLRGGRRDGKEVREGLGTGSRWWINVPSRDSHLPRIAPCSPSGVQWICKAQPQPSPTAPRCLMGPALTGLTGLPVF